MMITWFDNAAFEIFIADGGVDDFGEMSPEEIESAIRNTLLDYVPNILESALRLQERVND